MVPLNQCCNIVILHFHYRRPSWVWLIDAVFSLMTLRYQSLFWCFHFLPLCDLIRFHLLLLVLIDLFEFAFHRWLPTLPHLPHMMSFCWWPPTPTPASVYLWETRHWKVNIQIWPVVCKRPWCLFPGPSAFMMEPRQALISKTPCHGHSLTSWLSRVAVCDWCQWTPCIPSWAVTGGASYPFLGITSLTHFPALTSAGRSSLFSTNHRWPLMYQE